MKQNYKVEDLEKLTIEQLKAEWELSDHMRDTWETYQFEIEDALTEKGYDPRSLFFGDEDD